MSVFSKVTMTGLDLQSNFSGSMAYQQSETSKKKNNADIVENNDYGEPSAHN